MAHQFSNGYALIVGVGRYQLESLTVPVTGQDAEDLKDLLIDPDFCAYPEFQVRVLTNESASRQSIVDALNQLADEINTRQATVTLFFSGHGWYEDNTYYFLCHDTEFLFSNQPNDKRINAKTAISNDELISYIRIISQRANKTLVIFNTCFSGGLGTSLGPENDEFQDHLTPIPLSPFDDKLENLAQGKGTAIFASSQQQEKSWILGTVVQPARNSLFVEKLIAALKGEGIPSAGTTINLLPLIDAVKRSVREAAQKYNLSQDPDYKMYGGMQGDFPIALRRGGQMLSPELDVKTQPASALTKSTPGDYNYGTIRELLEDTFNPDDLDQFLYDSHIPQFRKIRRKFGPGMGLDKMIQIVMEECDRFLLMESLLKEVKAYNPARFSLYEDNLQ